METINNLELIKERIAHQQAVALLIKSKGCSVCVAVEEQLKQGAIKHNEVHVLQVSLEQVPEISGEYLVLTAPTLILFIGGKEQWRGSRFIAYNELNQMIQRFF
ncbi:hypothetical protein CR194_16050 [Salipaludibacillus keqinensis]|uniref:Thiol reductase thioredoxin n=1 Tax=Salipaludibacillus keqinensis TaxID=2045207 RepID=A0A323TSF1_9BACI|nr:thioredoxin family protein [Salipaludibacillus keqinensis]PYZ92345.1 hypothetical protein CR194_16050 [Salipaludibacillus keqinensis]